MIVQLPQPSQRRLLGCMFPHHWSIGRSLLGRYSDEKRHRSPAGASVRNPTFLRSPVFSHSPTHPSNESTTVMFPTFRSRASFRARPNAQWVPDRNQPQTSPDRDVCTMQPTARWLGSQSLGTGRRLRSLHPDMPREMRSSMFNLLSLHLPGPVRAVSRMAVAQAPRRGSTDKHSRRARGRPRELAKCLLSSLKCPHCWTPTPIVPPSDRPRHRHFTILIFESSLDGRVAQASQVTWTR